MSHSTLNNNGHHQTSYRTVRNNISNSNPSLDKSQNVQVEYEVAVPIIPSFRHTPYHSLWNLNQW